MEAGAIININRGSGGKVINYNYGSTSRTTKAMSDGKNFRALHDIVYTAMSVCCNKFSNTNLNPEDVKTAKMGKCALQVCQKVRDKWKDFRKFWKRTGSTTTQSCQMSVRARFLL